MPKYFAFSDVHGFYDELIEALEHAGYDHDNKDHVLVSCGDNWDRGKQPLEVMQYISTAASYVFVRGNHEDLFEDLIGREYPDENDKDNGTVDTVYRIGRSKDFLEACQNAYTATRKFLGHSINFYETKNYIFVHGWVPMQHDNIDPNWRNASQESWETARWTNGMAMAFQGLTIPNKTIVCGHWNASFGHFHSIYGDMPLTKRDMLELQFGDNANFNTFYGDGIIALDACTVISGKVNVVVLEDYEL